MAPACMDLVTMAESLLALYVRGAPLMERWHGSNREVWAGHDLPAEHFNVSMEPPGTADSYLGSGPAMHPARWGCGASAKMSQLQKAVTQGTPTDADECIHMHLHLRTVVSTKSMSDALQRCRQDGTQMTG